MRRVPHIFLLSVVIGLGVIVHVSFARSGDRHFHDIIPSWITWLDSVSPCGYFLEECTIVLVSAIIPAIAAVTWVSLPLICLRVSPFVTASSSILASLGGHYILFQPTLQKLEIMSYVELVLSGVLTAVGMATLVAWIRSPQTKYNVLDTNMSMDCDTDCLASASRRAMHLGDGFRFRAVRSGSLRALRFLVRATASSALVVLGMTVYWIVMYWGAWQVYERLFDGILQWGDSDLPRPWALVNVAEVVLMVIIPSVVAVTVLAIPLMWLRAHAFVVAGVAAVLPATALFTSRLLQGLPVHEGDGLLFYVSSILMGAILGVGFGSLCLERVVEENITQKSDLCGSM